MSETHDDTADQLRAKIAQLLAQLHEKQITIDDQNNTIAMLDREYDGAAARINELSRAAAHHERYIRELHGRIEAQPKPKAAPARSRRPPARRRAR